MKIAFLTTIFAVLFSLFNSANAASWMHYDQDNSPLPSNYISTILSDDAGTWVGTDNGLAFFDGSDWFIYDSETSELPDNNIRDIHKDNTGKIWVATDKGLLEISTDGWQTHSTSNSNIPSDYIRSVASDSEGNIWIGTWGNGIAAKNGNNWTVYNTDNSDLPSDGVFTVEIDELGVIWVGTFNGGVSKFNGLGWTTYNTSNSELPHNHVRSINFDQNHIAWFGTEDGVVRKTPGGHWDVYNAENIGYSFHTIYGGVIESAGKLYFATDGGILKFNGSDFSMVTSQNSSLPSNNVRSLALDLNGNLWVGSGNDGLSIYNPQGTLGVKEPLKTAESLTAYPNPTSNELTFLLPNKSSGNSEITVVNGTGQTVLTKQISNGGLSQHILDVSSLSTGTYFISVYSSTGISQGRFVKL